MSNEYPVIKSRYEVIELLSEDLVSFLYLGRHKQSQKPVLIWKYKSSYTTPAIIRKLISISETVMSIKDDRLLTLLDYAYDGKFFYTIYEQIEGMQTLEGFIKTSANWDLKVLWRLSTQLLSVLVKVESKKLVCGSINLSGIYVTGDGGLKLSRVGIPLEILKAHWDDFSVVEDLVFYPPEFVQYKRYTIQSDIYAYGVLLYLFFSKKWPYQLSLKIDELKKAFLKPQKPFTPAHSRVPERVRDIVHVCLALDPQKRFSSFSELVKSYRGDVPFSSQPVPEDSKEIRSALKKELRQRFFKKVLSFGYWVSGFTALIAIGYFAAVMYTSYLTAIPEKQVPDIVGMTFSQAEELLDDVGLAGSVVGTRVHPRYPEGTIVETKPPAGRNVKVNRNIRIFLSRGAGPVLVPDLVGRSEHNAMWLLDERGLGAEVSDEQFSIQYSKGMIIAQQPTPNTFINPSDNIQVVISKGFPIVMEVKKPRFTFFQEKTDVRRVLIELFILDEWDSQEVKVLFVHQGKSETIYSDVHNPGESMKLDFELDTGGRVDVYFGQDKAFTQKITDEKKTIDNREP